MHQYSLRKSISEAFKHHPIYTVEEHAGLVEYHLDDVQPSEWEIPGELLSERAAVSLRSRFLLRQRLLQAIAEGEMAVSYNLTRTLCAYYWEARGLPKTPFVSKRSWQRHKW
jgi:hypothetical protein